MKYCTWLGINGVKLTHHISSLSEHGDLSFLLYFSKQCLVGNIQKKFHKNCSATFMLRNLSKQRSSLNMYGYKRRFRKIFNASNSLSQTAG